METSMNSLLTSIEKTRMEMIQLAFQHGYTNPAVVQCSQKLDTLLNSYNHTADKPSRR
ncbi:aspartyl-phosphate phosphatase Spo0E family protein [Neobacillus niacini]|uniref:aspartyl-phosphate phosphatase Spo0E family protein n=1 Tax=Neobacillus niacini TaxID=86668 RepID=UPI0021CB403C|nr:aspartyl-phosphate phosphatase Spo0E family protein [Neobacillus niacini]MCM3765914.1 aspartyl-phosphate phosphatase Spo0E family protein [Neobacillus niacini]